MSAQASETRVIAPDEMPLNRTQARRLAGLTGLSATELTGLSVAEIQARYRWRIDPGLFLFRQICGKVVKTDPATGVQQPVPYAKVYAEDTDCTLLGLFPVESRFAWFFPLFCETEILAETTTDACGNFCVWVPVFEIEWILRFRRERICFLELFTRPTVASIIQSLLPNPGDPPLTSGLIKPNTALFQQAEQLLGAATARALADVGGRGGFGASTTAQAEILARPAFPESLPPALPVAFRHKPSHLGAEEHRAAVRDTLAGQLGLDPGVMRRFDLNNYRGPFLRCVDILVPEWVPFFEVPDISFKVTQDVNGNGVQEVIYSGGTFDIPWGAGNISGVVLNASQIAVASSNCNVPDVPCGNTPSIEFAGLMPLVNPPSPAAPYVDLAAGYATRPNPPRVGGSPAGARNPPATAPYCQTLQLYGCADVGGAAYYRLQYTFTPPGSATASAATPFKGLSWPLYREVGGILQSLWPVADPNGWYPVLPDSDGWFPGNLLLEWDTTGFANGLYVVWVETADSAKNFIVASASVGLRVDNSPPVVTYTAQYGFLPDLSDLRPMPTDDCMVIKRGETPSDIYVQLAYSASSTHLRYTEAYTGGCAAAALVSSSGPTQHWYATAGDTVVNNTAVYKIAGSSPQGSYSFAVYADTRAFNPAGSDQGPIDDWNYDPVYRWTNPSFAVAVVNENP